MTKDSRPERRRGLMIVAATAVALWTQGTLFTAPAAFASELGVDIGGEGFDVDDDGLKFGTDQAINSNRSLNRTPYGDEDKSIFSLVFGFAEYMPLFANWFVDKIIPRASVSAQGAEPNNQSTGFRPGLLSRDWSSGQT